MATIQETLMGLGDFSFDIDYDPEIADALDFYKHIVVYWGEDLIYAGVLLRRKVGKEGITIGGRGLEWWLGLDDEGPVIEDIEFVSGNNKLSNPSFDLDALYWRTKEDSAWTLAAGIATTNVAAVFEDDALQSDESFESEDGEDWYIEARVNRDYGATGRLRLRAVWDGKFNRGNILLDPSFEDVDAWYNDSLYPGDAAAGTGEIRLGPTTKQEFVPDPVFANGGADWAPVGSWTFVLGDAEATPPPGAGNTASITPIYSASVTPGLRYAVTARIQTYGAPDGEAFIQVDTWDDPGGPVTYRESTHHKNEASAAVVEIREDLTIPDTHDSLMGIFVVQNETLTTWQVHSFNITREENNTCVIGSADPMLVTPERAYEGAFSVEVDDTFVSGDVKMVAFYGSLGGRDYITVDIASWQPQPGQNTLWDFTLKPPSGYDLCWIEFTGKDIIGGSVRLKDGWIRDADTSTYVIDDVSSETTGDEVLSVTHASPVGAERFHVEVIAENSANGWGVQYINLERTDESIADTGDVIDAVLRDPDTDDYLITPGDIVNDDSQVPYDLRYRNMTNAQVLRQFSRVACSPKREWRVNPDNTFDWGEAEQIFDIADFLLVRGDLILIGPPEVELNAENQLTREKVIGADRAAVGQRHRYITAKAEVEPEADDWFGHDVRRTRIVADATVDHINYAQALADYDIERSSATPSTISAQLSDWNSVGDFRVGDWLQVYKPESGIEDVANPQDYKGDTVYPKKIRVLDRTWQLGPGNFSVFLRAPGGALTELTTVRWETGTVATVTLGDPASEFVADPQAGATGNQFLRYRASSPR